MVTDELKEKERTLERLELEDQVAEKRLSIKQKRALEKRLQKETGEGTLEGVKKVLGIVGKLRINPETVQTLHSQSSSLRNLSIPRGRVRR